MFRNAPSPASRQSAARPDQRIGDVTPDAASPEGDFAAGVRERASHTGGRGDFATGASSRIGSALRTSGDFASGLRAQACVAVIGDFATGVRAPRVALPAAVADRSRSKSERAEPRWAA